MIARDGYIKLVDFGIAFKGQSYDSCGTLEYMAPEILLK